jgi:manganese/iron transport system ATP-binding protein
VNFLEDNNKRFLVHALTQQAEIFCFDEPFVGIDQKAQTIIFEIFHELAAENKTILVVITT